MERLQVYLMAIQFSKEEMQEMESMIADFLERMEIRRDLPIDIFKVAADLGFDVRGAEFENQLEGLVIINENLDKIDGFDSNKVIAYNCFKDIHTKKFIVAHELAHYISEKTAAYNRKIVVAAREHGEDYSENCNEQKMDYIAASLLIPRDDLRRFLESHQEKSILDVAERYNVSEKMAERRMAEVMV